MLVEEVVGKFKGECIYISIRNLPLDCFTCGFKFSFHNKLTETETLQNI